MRKLYILGLALLGVLAASAAMASSAFAVAEWLANGGTFTGELLTETTGELTLIHLAGLFTPEVRVKCSGIFDGVVLGGGGADGLGGEDLVTELLNLAGTAKVELGKELECEVTQTGSGGCEVLSPTETFVAPEHLPWLTKLTLMAVPGGSLYLDLFTEDTEGGNPGLPAYYIDCLVNGVLKEVVCEGETSAEITLSGPDLLGIFNKAELESEGLEATCLLDKVSSGKTGLQEGSGTIVDAEGAALDVSE